MGESKSLLKRSRGAMWQGDLNVSSRAAFCGRFFLVTVFSAMDPSTSSIRTLRRRTAVFGTPHSAIKRLPGLWIHTASHRGLPACMPYD
jgi:hypothetical protein